MSYLYHYTNDVGLGGIIQSNTLWATSIFHLNDSEEFRTGIELLRQRIEGFKGRRPGSEPTIYDRCLEVLNLLVGDPGAGGPPEEQLPIYVASFSSERNLLSQWRAYCPRGGFSIGFRKDKLRALAKRQGFLLRRCLYDQGDKIRIIDCFLQTLLNKAAASDRDVRHSSFEAQDGRYWEIADGRLWRLLPIIPRLKHAGFFEEREWRLTSDLQASDRREQFGYRLKGGQLVRYKVLELTQELWADCTITISPGPHKEMTQESIQKLIVFKGLPIRQPQIQTSGIPYRP